MSIFDQLDGLDSRVESLSRALGDLSRSLSYSPQLTGSEQPASDPLGIVGRAGMAMGALGSVKLGVVADAVPHAKAYRVLSAEGPLVMCYALTPGSTSPIGVTGSPSYQPQTPVIYLQMPGTSYGLIVGAIPRPRTEDRELRPDAIYQGLISGLGADWTHRAPLQLQFPGIENRSARTPFDSVELNEFIQMSATGIMILIDDFMAQLRVDEETGLFLFYMDQLARLSGHNLEIRSASWDFESWVVGSRASIEEGIAFSEDEALGIIGQLFDRFTEYEGVEGRAVLEPGNPEAQAFHRLLRWSGALARGHKQLLVAPGTQRNWNLMTDPSSQTVGLSEALYTLTGSIGFRASGLLTVGRRPAIVVPKRTLARGSRDPIPDRPRIWAPIPETPELPKSVVSALTYLDQEARLYNWEGGAEFYYDQEHNIPSESEIQVRAQQPPNYGELQEKQFMSPPDPTRVWISEEEGEIDIYPTSNATAYLPEGSTVEHDGYGGTVISTGGSKVIDVPGDLVLRAGRRIVIEAPDVVIKAHDDVDITSSNGAIRTKSETDHVMIVANGGGDHGLLVDSRSESDRAGIILKADDGLVSTISKSTYIRTTDNGDIILDAGRGDGQVLVHAQEIMNFVASRIATLFGRNGEFTANASTSAQGTVLPGTLHTTGSIQTEGSVLSGGSGYFFGGNVHSAVAASNGGKLGAVGGGGVPSQSPDFQSRLEYLSSFENGVYGERGIGRDEVIDQELKGALRSQEEYGTEEYLVIAPPWAVTSVDTGASQWSEPDVVGPKDVKTYPFPGTKSGSSNQVVVQTTFIDTGSGIANPIGPDGYAQPEEVSAVIREGVRTVLKKPSTPGSA